MKWNKQTWWSSSSLLYHWYHIQMYRLKFRKIRYPEPDPTCQIMPRQFQEHDQPLQTSPFHNSRSMCMAQLLKTSQYWCFNFPYPFPHKLWHLSLMIQDDQAWAKGEKKTTQIVKVCSTTATSWHLTYTPPWLGMEICGLADLIQQKKSWHYRKGGFLPRIYSVSQVLGSYNSIAKQPAN